MNKVVLKQWIEALESGKFQQDFNFMHSTNGFCPFGVLVELYREKFGGEWIAAKCWCKELSKFFMPHFEFLGSSHLPSEEVLKWLDLKCSCKDKKEHEANCEADIIVRVMEGAKSFQQIAAELKKLL